VNHFLRLSSPSTLIFFSENDADALDDAATAIEDYPIDNGAEPTSGQATFCASLPYMR
jgi:hypothetical protein